MVVIDYTGTHETPSSILKNGSFKLTTEEYLKDILKLRGGEK